jgi:hypothetical protein
MSVHKEWLSQRVTIALQEILEQPIKLRADAEFKRGSATVEFWIDHEGYREDVYRGQGGSVANINILSVGLRLFALTTLDPAQHRRFLVLDEQDCWLRPDLVPKLVKIVQEAGRAFGFQVIMISHHDLSATHFGLVNISLRTCAQKMRGSSNATGYKVLMRSFSSVITLSVV